MYLSLSFVRPFSGTYARTHNTLTEGGEGGGSRTERFGLPFFCSSANTVRQRRQHWLVCATCMACSCWLLMGGRVLAFLFSFILFLCPCVLISFIFVSFRFVVPRPRSFLVCRPPTFFPSKPCQQRPRLRSKQRQQHRRRGRGGAASAPVLISCTSFALPRTRASPCSTG